MGKLTEYDQLDALGLAGLVGKGEVTPGELVEEAIARIERLNPRINAVIQRQFEQARKLAKDALPDGPFRGVPFLLKDIHSQQAGIPYTLGSRFFAEYRPDQDSELVRRFKASGVLILGRTNTPEFGLVPTTEPEMYGPCRNPWNPELSTGGSSGGSAAAVAARMVPFAGAADGGGSIRIPASCCGLFGLKPTRGRTPTGPQDADLWNGLCTEHVLTRTVRDSAAMLDAVAGHFPGDWHYLPKPERPYLSECTTKPGKLKIAYSPGPMFSRTFHPDCHAAQDEALKLLAEMGHELHEVELPIERSALIRGFVLTNSAALWAVVKEAEKHLGKKADRTRFETNTWLARALGSSIHAGEFVLNMRLLQREARKFHEFMKDYHAMLQPTLGLPPQPLGFLKPKRLVAIAESVLERFPVGKVIKSQRGLEESLTKVLEFTPNTPVANVTGQPSMSVPLHANAQGLPIGVMFTGNFGDEATLFRLAGQLEQARPWADRRPPVCDD